MMMTVCSKETGILFENYDFILLIIEWRDSVQEKAASVKSRLII